MLEHYRNLLEVLVQIPPLSGISPPLHAYYTECLLAQWIQLHYCLLEIATWVSGTAAVSIDEIE